MEIDIIKKKVDILKDLGCWDKLLANYRQQNSPFKKEDMINNNEVYNFLIRFKTKEVVNFLISWSSSNEGSAYWVDIYRKLHDYGI